MRIKEIIIIDRMPCFSNICSLLLLQEMHRELDGIYFSVGALSLSPSQTFLGFRPPTNNTTTTTTKDETLLRLNKFSTRLVILINERHWTSDKSKCKTHMYCSCSSNLLFCAVFTKSRCCECPNPFITNYLFGIRSDAANKEWLRLLQDLHETIERRLRKQQHYINNSTIIHEPARDAASELFEERALSQEANSVSFDTYKREHIGKKNRSKALTMGRPLLTKFPCLGRGS